MLRDVPHACCDRTVFSPACEIGFETSILDYGRGTSFSDFDVIPENCARTAIEKQLNADSIRGRRDESYGEGIPGSTGRRAEAVGDNVRPGGVAGMEFSLRGGAGC